MYLLSSKETLCKAHEVARETLRASQKSMKRYNSLTCVPKGIRSMISLLAPQCRVKKGKPVWLGPGIVTQITLDRVCIIQNRGYEKIMHHDKMRPCNSRKPPM